MRDFKLSGEHIGLSEEEETDRLLSARTRDIRLSDNLNRLHRKVSWRQRSKIVRAWTVWVTVEGLLFIPISYTLMPHVLTETLLNSLIVVPLLHACLFAVWRRPRPDWVEGLSVLVIISVFFALFAGLGALGGGANAERFATGSFFVVIVGLVVFDVAMVWTVSLALSGLTIYLAFLLRDPTLNEQSALAVFVYYCMGAAAVIVARRTVTIINQRQFLFMLRDLYRSRALTQANAQLERLATRDPLTGLANRRFAAERLASLWADRALAKRRIAFVMMDIDNFKALNDSAGHAAGDVCIAQVANILEAHAGKDDIVCRYGGEEFLMVLRNVSQRQAYDLAERVRLDVEIRKIANPGLGPDARVTVSLGVAFAAEGLASEHVTKCADEALYQAKGSGRNRVCIAGAPDSAQPPALAFAS